MNLNLMRMMEVAMMTMMMMLAVVLMKMKLHQILPQNPILLSRYTAVLHKRQENRDNFSYFITKPYVVTPHQILLAISCRDGSDEGASELQAK